MARKKAETVAENVENSMENGAKNVESVLIAKKAFRDIYTKNWYEVGTKFVVKENVNDTTKISDKEYQISVKRAEELINNLNKVV